MSIKTQHLKLKQLHQLIENEFTGKPDQLSILLGVSPRVLARYLDILRELGAHIRYSRSMETYYFATPANIDFGLSPKRKKELSNH